MGKSPLSLLNNVGQNSPHVRLRRCQWAFETCRLGVVDVVFADEGSVKKYVRKSP